MILPVGLSSWNFLCLYPYPHFCFLTLFLSSLIGLLYSDYDPSHQSPTSKIYLKNYPQPSVSISRPCSCNPEWKIQLDDSISTNRLAGYFSRTDLCEHVLQMLVSPLPPQTSLTWLVPSIHISFLFLFLHCQFILITSHCLFPLRLLGLSFSIVTTNNIVQVFPIWMRWVEWQFPQSLVWSCRNQDSKVLLTSSLLKPGEK